MVLFLTSICNLPKPPLSTFYLDLEHYIIMRYYFVDSSVSATRSSSCEWVYGSNGNEISCEEGRVMAGACGSRNRSNCPGGTHGAYCCNVEDRS